MGHFFHLFILLLAALSLGLPIRLVLAPDLPRLARRCGRQIVVFVVFVVFRLDGGDFRTDIRIPGGN